MFELINTSVPVGLLPGTRGFTTVSMTRGMPAGLQRLCDSLAAYSFRATSHDERYVQENPRNFFHYILSHGEHVLGSVAACEFDYTGRTNRLAHLLVFGREEFAENAAGFLDANRALLEADWTGEPRYIERPSPLASKPLATEAITWRVVFGAPGADLCRRVAADLEERIRQGSPRSPFFSSTTGCDRTVIRLLALSDEVISLLPEDIRASVTFSTYPTNIPAGSVCHLAGAYDDTPAFAVASASQPWVDCLGGRLVNEEALLRPVAQPVPERTHAPEAPVRISLPTSPKASPRAARQRVNAALLRKMSEDKTSDSSFYVMLVCLLGIAVGAVVLAYWFFVRPSQSVDLESELLALPEEASVQEPPPKAEPVAEPEPTPEPPPEPPKPAPPPKLDPEAQPKPPKAEPVAKPEPPKEPPEPVVPKAIFPASPELCQIKDGVLDKIVRAGEETCYLWYLASDGTLAQVACSIKKKTFAGRTRLTLEGDESEAQQNATGFVIYSNRSGSVAYVWINRKVLQDALEAHVFQQGTGALKTPRSVHALLSRGNKDLRRFFAFCAKERTNPFPLFAIAWRPIGADDKAWKTVGEPVKINETVNLWERAKLAHEEQAKELLAAQKKGQKADKGANKDEANWNARVAKEPVQTQQVQLRFTLTAGGR